MRKRKVAVILFLVLLVGCGIAPDTGGNSFPASASAMEPPQSVSSYIEDVDVSSEMVDVWTQTRSTDECDFINGPDGAEKATLKVGDTFLGLELTTLSASEVPDSETGEYRVYRMDADFSGEVVLKGVLSNSIMSGLNFCADKETSALLPCIPSETRITWFRFTNPKEVAGWLEQLGMELIYEESNGERKETEIECEIVIDTYSYVVWETDASNLAHAVEIRNAKQNTYHYTEEADIALPFYSGPQSAGTVSLGPGSDIMGFTLEDTRRTNCYRNTESLPYSTDIDAHFDGWVAVRGHFVKEEWETFFVVDADTAGLFPVIYQPGAVEQDVLRLKVTNRDGAIAEQIEKEAYNTTDTYEIIVHDYSIHSFFSQNQEVYKGQSEQTYSGYIAKVTLAA